MVCIGTPVPLDETVGRKMKPDGPTANHSLETELGLMVAVQFPTTRKVPSAFHFVILTALPAVT